jgi:U3 small nucleolar RNA-associated protein 18
MAKHPRKRQKTSKGSEYENSHPNKTARLGMLLDDESKDDEERRLESLLFGVKYVPREKGKEKMKDSSDEDEQAEDVEEESGRGLQHLLDQDVCLKLFLSDGEHM